MASKLSDMQWSEVEELGRSGMRGAAIRDALELDIHPANLNKHLAKKGIGATGEPAELTLAESRREQMEALFSNYRDVKPLYITKAKEGTRVVVLSDAQIPYHEPWLIGGPEKRDGAVERFIKDYSPDILILNGDWLDAYSVSTFDKAPSRRFGLSDELRLTGNSLDTLTKAAPNARKIFNFGNHEERLSRALISICQKDIRALELFGAVNLQTLDAGSLLHLNDRGWEYQPYGSYVDLLGFVVAHGNIVASEAGETARRMYQKYHSSGTSGHTHRAAVYTHRDGVGKEHAWIESGCLCRLDLEYLNGGEPNWTQAFVVGEVLNNKLHTSLVTVFDEKFWVPGLGVYQAKK